MKHLTADSHEVLATLLSEAGLEVEITKRERILVYLDELLSANEAINLTRVVESAAAVRLHIVDSLMALPEIHDAPSGVMLDLGSGGGFPGVPLAVASGRETVLLDSVAKKGSAVSAILEREAINQVVRVVSERAEEHAAVACEYYAVVVARAVAPLPALLELASPLLQDGGVLVALKGVPDERELNGARAVAAITGFGQPVIRRFALPGGDERRMIVSARKCGKARLTLPRRVGLAQKSPLG